MAQRISRTDIAPIGELFTTLGAMLGQQVTRNGAPMTAGEAAWLNSLDFMRGPRAATADPDSGGNRWETDDDGDVWPIPNDTTGEAATTTDQLAGLHIQYRTLLGWLLDNGNSLRRTVEQLLPPQPNTKVVPCNTCGTPLPVVSKRRREWTDAELIAAGFCVSCHRVDQRCTEIQTRPNGQRYYHEFCRFCGSFKADHGIEPPLAVLRVRFRDGQVPVAVVEEHCDHCKAKANSGRPKGRRGGWRRTPVS